MPTLELTFAPADAALFARLPGITRRGRTSPALLEWHDTPEGTLKASSLILTVTRGACRIEPLRPPLSILAPRPLAVARTPALLDGDLPDGLAPVARFEGASRALVWSSVHGPVTIRTLIGPTGPGRIRFDGEAGALEALILTLPLDVPRSSLAEAALGQAAPRAIGAPRIEPGTSISDSLATVVGHLLDVLLHWADRAAVEAGQTSEPVHQARVALRRLRSALSVFRHALPCPALAALSESLRTTTALFGAARDWDVFLAGTGVQLAKTFPDDPRWAAMLRAGARRRRVAYATLATHLASPEFRTLTVSLALAAALRPWEPLAVETDAGIFASDMLARRYRHVRRAGRQIAELSIPDLHALRKDCKRLRYTAEFFAALYPPKPTRRFLARLATLQEELGLLNDGAAISGLMAQLGRAERGFAAGLVEGFTAARSGPARNRIIKGWGRFRKAEPFWGP